MDTIYNWLTKKYARVLGQSFQDVVCLGPVLINGRSADVNIAPGTTVGHPPRELLRELTKARSDDDREQLVATRPSVVISEGVIVGPYSIVYEGVELQRNVFVEGRSIIRRCSFLGENTTIYFGAYIGEDVKVGRNCKIGGFICNNASVEDECAILGALVHDYPIPGMKKKERSPKIKENVLVAMNSMIIGGVVIGKNAKIAAGAIVLSDVRENKLITGIHK